MKFSMNQAVYDKYNKKACLIIKGFGGDANSEPKYFCCKASLLREAYGWITESEIVSA